MEVKAGLGCSLNAGRSYLWQDNSVVSKDSGLKISRYKLESRSAVSDSLRPHGLHIVHGILQARILEWVAFPFSGGSSQPRDRNPGLPHCRRVLYQLSHKGSLGLV